MKRLLVPIILLLLLIASCKTREERANRLIERANKLYPLKSMVSTIIKIDTLIKYDTTFVIKGDTIKTVIKLIDSNKKSIIYDNKVIKDNEKYKLTINTLPTGDLDFKVEVKERKETIKGEIRFKIDTLIKKEYIKTAPTEVKVKGLFWWIGLTVTILIGAGLVFLSIRTAKRLKLF